MAVFFVAFVYYCIFGFLVGSLAEGNLTLPGEETVDEKVAQGKVTEAKSEEVRKMEVGDSEHHESYAVQHHRKG